MENIPNIPGKMAEKIPEYEDFQKDKKGVVQWIGLLLFIAYLAYNEYFRRDDCKESIAVIQQTLNTEREMHKNTYNMLTKRIQTLEEGYMVKSKALNTVSDKVGASSPDPIIDNLTEGGSQ